MGFRRCGSLGAENWSAGRISLQTCSPQDHPDTTHTKPKPKPQTAEPEPAKPNPFVVDLVTCHAQAEEGITLDEYAERVVRVRMLSSKEHM